MNDTPPSGALVRQEFGAVQAMTGTEMQAQALAAQVKAAVEARYILAMRRPRNLDTVRVKLTAECRRPGFAEDARYIVPRGRKQNAQGQWEDNLVSGPSIRFAEAAARYMGNIDSGTMTIYDDASSRQVRVTAIDLESNVTFYKDITIHKTMERKKLRQNQVAIGERYTSAGELVYIVEIPDSELTNIQAAAESKALRTLLLRFVPGDIVDECMDLCVAILKDQHAKDPREAIKKMCDGYARLGISPDELVSYIGKPLDQMTPDEYQHLRSLGIALRDGQARWAEALEAKLEGRQVATPAPAPAPKTEAAAATPAPDAAKPAQDASSAPQSAPAAPPPAQPPAAASATQGQQSGKARGSKAVVQQVKAKAKEAAAAPAPTPGPGSPEWEAAKERAANKPAPLAAAPAPAPEPQPDPHGDPPPPDDVILPGDGPAPDPEPHPAGDAPDWMS